MKKIFLLLILLGFLSSCGPHRMRCGPGRCDLDETNYGIEKKEELKKNPSIEGFFYEAISKRFNRFLVKAS